MNKLARRQFLHKLSVLAGSFSVVGCGAGSSSESQAAPAPPTSGSAAPAPAAAAPATPSSVAPPPSSGARAFTLVSASAAELAPFSLGFAFRKGDIPSGQGVVGSIDHLQVVPKNRWPDGSLKFATVSGRATLAADKPLSVTLTAGAPAGAAALTLADLKATGAAASIGCGAFGTVAWSGADWDSPFQAWVSGPQMSSWIYRKPVGNDAHLVGWLEVRLYAGGAVEVLPWIENGYLRVAGPSNRSATYTFMLGGTQRFIGAIDLPHHCRTPLLSGGSVAHWLGTDPGIALRQDAIHLQETGLVPTYRAKTPASASVVKNMPTSFAPLQVGQYSGGMGSAGYHPSIGLLPEWDVLYLTCAGAAGLDRAIAYQAYSAGRYALHYRDEKTNRPLRFSAQPHVSLNASGTGDVPPASTGTGAPTWAESHHPSVGYLAYLVTGRWYHLETLQFAATRNYLAMNSVYREQAGGVYTGQPRVVAWCWRTLAQAACATPDDDPLRSEFIASLAANANYYHRLYVAQPNNPHGWTRPYGANQPPNNDGYSPAVDPHHDASWMHDFWLAAIGYGKSLQLLDAPNQSRYDAFYAWKANALLGRFGGAGPNEFLYRDAAPYIIAVAPKDSSDWVSGAGPWFSHWGEIWNYTWGANGVQQGSPLPKEIGDGSLRGGPSATNYWANLQPAMAYVVSHGLPGAAEAYAKLTAAPNWPALVAAFDADPVWGIAPLGLAR